MKCEAFISSNGSPKSELQRASIALSSDPDGYGPRPDYAGFGGSVGWIISAGREPHTAAARAIARRRLTWGLGHAYSRRNKRAQNEVVASLPHDATSGLPTGKTWDEVSPDDVKRSMELLR